MIKIIPKLVFSFRFLSYVKKNKSNELYVVIMVGDNACALSFSRYLRWSDCDSGDDYNRSDHINDYDYEYYYNDRDDRLTKVAQRSTSKKRPKQQQRRRSAKIPRTRERPALTSKIIDDDGLTGSSNDLCDCVLSRTRCQKCSELNRFKCYYCPMVFLKLDERNRHLRASHRKELLRNSFELFYRVGQKIEEDEGEVVDEMITDTIDQLPQSSEYECDNCADQFNDKVTLIEHLNDHEKHEKQIVVNDDDFDDREISDAPDELDEDEETTMEARRQYISIAVARRSSRKSPKTLACSKYSNISSENAASDSAAYECAICAGIFSSKGEIRKHLSSVHDFKTPKLSYGLKSCTAKKEESKIIQELAKQSFRQFGTYTVPERGEPSSQTSAGYYICAVCGQIFLKRHSFTRHVNQHSSSRLNCDKCKKSFTTKGALQSHQNLKHKDLPKNVFILNGRKYLKCEQCSFTCRNERNKMEEHMRVHTGEKPFTCELCGKQFRTKALLRVHSRYVHEGIKEHACDICGRCFSNKRYMEEHRRIHTGEKPLICDLCGKTFRQNSSLTKHVENHLGIKRHGCHLCGKRYSNSHHLSIHIKRHMGEANFMCDQCGKGFVDQYQLKNHKVVHSEERPFVCMLCGTGFKLLKHLKQHGRTHKTC